MVDARRINEIQNAVMYPHVLRKRIAAEVHHGGGRSGFQVDALQSVDTVGDEKSIKRKVVFFMFQVVFELPIGTFYWDKYR